MGTPEGWAGRGCRGCKGPSVHPGVNTTTAPRCNIPTASSASPGKASTVSEGGTPKTPLIPPLLSPACPCHLTLRVPSDQRKDYGQTLLKLQSDFQHHVEVEAPSNCPAPPRPCQGGPVPPSLSPPAPAHDAPGAGPPQCRGLSEAPEGPGGAGTDLGAGCHPGSQGPGAGAERCGEQGTPRPGHPQTPVPSGRGTFWLCDPTKPGTPGAGVPSESWYPPSKAPQSPALLSQGTP